MLSYLSYGWWSAKLGVFVVMTKTVRLSKNRSDVKTVACCSSSGGHKDKAAAPATVEWASLRSAGQSRYDKTSALRSSITKREIQEQSRVHWPGLPVRSWNWKFENVWAGTLSSWRLRKRRDCHRTVTRGWPQSHRVSSSLLVGGVGCGPDLHYLPRDTTHQRLPGNAHHSQGQSRGGSHVNNAFFSFLRSFLPSLIHSYVSSVCSCLELLRIFVSSCVIILYLVQFFLCNYIIIGTVLPVQLL